MALRDREIKFTTLCFVFDRPQNKLLMIQKKRGQGAGKWNVPGGKIQKGETASAAAIRETMEETGITPISVIEAGKLEFYFPTSESWDNICTVFTCDHFEGTLIQETEECSAHWIDLNKIPYEKMWDDDKRWIPLLLEGKKFHRAYIFDSLDQMLEEKIII